MGGRPRVARSTLPEVGERKRGAQDGRGQMSIDLGVKDALGVAAASSRSLRNCGRGRGGNERDETLAIRALDNA